MMLKFLKRFCRGLEARRDYCTAHAHCCSRMQEKTDFLVRRRKEQQKQIEVLAQNRKIVDFKKKLRMC